MPLIKSAKKRMKQDIKKTARNNAFRRSMREAIKALKKGVHDASEGVPELLKKAQSTIDTAAKKNLIHKNNASRKKSSAAKLVASVK